MQVIDDFLPPEMFKELQDKILGPTFTFNYIPTISAPEWLAISDPLAKETDAFALAMYNVTKSSQGLITKTTQEYLELKPMFMYMLHKLGYTEGNLTRVRCNTTLSVPGVTSEYYNLPHVDSPSEHKSVVFYLNDSDGDTRLFHQRQKPFNWRLREDATIEEKREYGNEFIRSGFTVEHTVTPKANRLLIFDGLQYHASGFPVNSRRRVVLNINISEQVEKRFD